MSGDPDSECCCRRGRKKPVALRLFVSMLYLLMALLGPREMSHLNPQSGPKETGL
jgi:hypothetical protein